MDVATKQQKMDIRFGMWNVRLLYKAETLKIAARVHY